MEQVTANLKSEPETLTQFLLETAHRFGDRPALSFKAGLRYRHWSYAQLWEESGKVASLLQQRGINKGDRVLLWGPNYPQWVLVFFGCMRAGVIAVPLDLRSNRDFVWGVVSKVRPRLAFVSRVTPCFHKELGIAEIDLEELEELYQGLPAAEPVAVASEDLAEVMFTSGTTGDPKGVMLTHGNLMANIGAIGRHTPGKSSDRLLSILPLSHMFEQMAGLLTPLSCGANVTYPTSRQPTILLKTMKERKVTLLLLVPQALDLFMRGIEREVSRQGRDRLWRQMTALARYTPFRARRLLFRRVHQRFGGCLKLIFSGGAALDPELGAKWNLLGYKVMQGYGATEASPVISSHTSHRPRYDSAGTPLPGVDVEIAQDGEVLVRGANVTPGYWESADQTASAFTDGWYKTGDLGVFDNLGFLHIKGRKKDMIVLANGQNVFPEDIETLLHKHPDTGDAVVVGLPKGSDVEVHAVFLTPEPEKVPNVVSWANGQLAEHQQIRGFTVWPEEDFPRTHTLKVKKGLVLDAIGRSASTGPAPGTARDPGRTGAERGLHHLVAEVGEIPLEQVTAEKTLGTDLNLDSLGRVELLSLIEQELGVYIDESLMSPTTTIAELEELVERQAQSTAALPRFSNWPLTGWCMALREALQAAVIFPLFAAFHRTRVTGLENLENLRGPAIFALNHNATRWDSFLLLRALPRGWRRRLAFAAAAEITFDSLWKGFLASLLANAFPLSRDTAIRASLEHIGRLLDGGWSVVIFPEGDQRVGEEMLPFQSGTGLLGVECRTPIIPVRLVNHGRPGGWLPAPLSRESLSVRIGGPLTFSPDVSYPEATQAIEDTVRSL